MKKHISFILTVILIITCFQVMSFAAQKIEVTYDLTTDGTNDFTAQTGDEIKVTLTIKRTDSTNGYSINSLQDYIVYDTEFFQLVSTKNPVCNVKNGSVTAENTISGPRVYMTDMMDTLSAEQEFGSFTLRVIGTSGEGWVKNANAKAYDNDNNEISITSKDLKVRIGKPLRNAPNVGTASASSTNASDGKITGTTVDMEYSKDQLSWTPAGGTEITGLKAGTYYVRYKQTENDKPSKTAVVTVSALGGNSGGNGGGGGSSAKEEPQTYAIKLNGLGISADKDKAKSGDTVTLTVPEGKKVLVKDANNNEVPVSEENGTYTFKMPDSEVNVSFYDTTVSDSKSCPRDSTCPIDKFTDTKNDYWWHDGIHYCLDKKLMNGTYLNIFEPNGTTTRAMIVTILYRLEGEPTFMNDTGFTDLEAESWYEKAVVWADGKDIVNGYDELTFAPSDNITREQLITILYRYAKYKGADVSSQAEISEYKDANKVSGWALTAMKWANSTGVAKGRTETELVPTGTATRAEAAAMIQRFCEQVIE